MAAQNNERPFNPTDPELVEDYLLNIVKGNPHPTDIDVLINTADVYGDCGTWEKLFEFLEKDSLYFFKRLTPRPGNDSRICREAKEGTWRGQHRPTDIYDVDGKLIGSKGNFSFVPKEGLPEPSSKWVMHEYRFKGRYAYIDNLYVLCRIRKMKSKNGSTAAIDIDEEAVSQKMMELENVIRGGGGGEGVHREP